MSELLKTFALEFARGGDAGGDLRRSLGGRRQDDRRKIPRRDVAAIETREMARWLALLTRLKLQIGVWRNRAFLRKQAAAAVVFEQGVERTMWRVHFGVLDRVDLLLGKLERREAAPASGGRGRVFEHRPRFRDVRVASYGACSPSRARARGRPVFRSSCWRGAGRRSRSLHPQGSSPSSRGGHGLSRLAHFHPLPWTRGIPALVRHRRPRS